MVPYVKLYSSKLKLDTHTQGFYNEIWQRPWKHDKEGEDGGIMWSWECFFKEKSWKMEQKQPRYPCVRTLLKLNPFKILIMPLKSNPRTDLGTDTERK